MSTGVLSLIQLATGTQAEWLDCDPVLAEGQPGYISDTNELVIGDGVTPFSGLPRIGAGGGGATSVITDTIAGNKIATHNNGLGALSDIRETVTSFSLVGTVLRMVDEAGNNNDVDTSIIPVPSHTHTASDVTDFDTEVSNNTDVNANTLARHDEVTLGGVANDTTDDTLDLTGQEITVNLVTTTTDGAMSAADKLKLDGISGDGGEDNTASNVGAGDGVFKQKTGVDLEFKSIEEGSNKVSVSNTADEVVIDVNEANLSITASQVTDFDTEVSNNTDVTANSASRHDEVTVTDSANIDLSVTGQDVTADLINTAVIPGSYTSTDITVDANGRITAASNGSIGTPPDATETVKGIAEIATQAETDAAVDDTRIVTPLKLSSYVAGNNTWVTSITTTSLITANQDDFTTAGLQPFALIRVDMDGNHDFTGLDSTGFSGGDYVFLKAIGGDLKLKSNNANSLAVNRFGNVADRTIKEGDTGLLIYDSIDQRWSVVRFD